MKTCGRCHEPKDESEFGKDASRNDGLSSRCKPCDREVKRQSSLLHKEEKIEYDRQYALDHPEKVKEKRDRFYARHREEILAKQREKNKNDPEGKRRSRQKSDKKHRATRAAYHKDYNRNRRATDVLFKTIQNIRRIVLNAFERKGYEKTTQTRAILGCDFEELQAHLVETAILNYGFYDPKQAYEIDHIMPMVTATSEDEVVKLNHYTNLQFLTPRDNRAKGTKIGWMTEYRQKCLTGSSAGTK